MVMNICKHFYKNSTILILIWNLLISQMKKRFQFLDLKLKLNDGKISTDLYIKSTNKHKFKIYILHHHILIILRDQ